MAQPATTAEKLEAATRLKNEGNELLGRGELRQAARKYRTVFLYVNGLVTGGEEVAQFTPQEDIITTAEEEVVRGLKTVVYANLALAYLKLGELDKTVDVADKALALDPAHVKSLVRKGQALTKLQDFDKAKAVLLEANKLEPENRAIRAELAAWKKAYLAWKEVHQAKQKTLFGNAFATSNPAAGPSAASEGAGAAGGASLSSNGK